MNPPFTRDSLRHDQFDRETEKKIKSKEKELFANRPVHLSSNGNAFILLADFIRKANDGVIAAVLPLVTATNGSSLEIRKYLASNYHIETIVTSHDPGRIYFSENTSIGEMLLVCRHWSSKQGLRPPTKVINLAYNPETPAAAKSLAWAIENGTVMNQGFGTVQEWPAAKIAVGDWGAVQFYSEFLTKEFATLKRGELFRSVALGTVSQIGPDGRGLRGNFSRPPSPSPAGMVALWDHKTDVTQSMRAVIDSQITPKPGKQKQAQHLWSQRGRLLLPTRIRLNTVRTLSVRLSTSAIGSAWVPCKPMGSDTDVEHLEKALCIYFNSTIGILALLGNRSNKIPSYPQFSMDDMRKYIVPDFEAPGDAVVTRLAAAYDELSNRPLLPLPEMDGCDVRKALDEAVCDALDIEPERTRMIRRNLAAEPSVTGQRYVGWFG